MKSTNNITKRAELTKTRINGYEGQEQRDSKIMYMYAHRLQGNVGVNLLPCFAYQFTFQSTRGVKTENTVQYGFLNGFNACMYAFIIAADL